MTRLLEALRSQRTDEGFTLVEAVVSMVILALLSTGIIVGTNTISKMTQDNRSRQVAVNLAERQLDLDRGILDPLKISSFGNCPNGENSAGTAATTAIVSGRTYTISQCSSLVSVDGTDITCGSGKALNYRRIAVTVDWTGRLATTTLVQSDTIMSPNGRINDASTGSIAVQVTGATGTGEPGVSVQIDPNGNGAMALQSQPPVTNVDGCTYALGVTPGTYKVTITNAGSVDTKQVTAPSNSLPVTAGATTPYTFTYDQAVNYSLSYAVPSPTATASTALLPTTMPVTFLTGNGNPPYITASTAAAPTTAKLFPYPAGWTAYAGSMVDSSGNPTCAANNPTLWPGGSYGGKTLTAGASGNTLATAPGGSGTLAVPMGTFTVNTVGGVYIKAVQQSVTTNGQPGCGAPQTFTFSKLTLSGTSKLALPYGTYTLYSGNALGAITTLVGSALSVTPATDAVNGALSTFTTSTSTLTLDPRSGS